MVSESSERDETVNSAPQTGCIPSSPKRGLKRMEGTIRLKPIDPMTPLTRDPIDRNISKPSSSSCSPNSAFTNFNPQSNTTSQFNMTRVEDKFFLFKAKPPTSGLTKTKTSIEPLNQTFSSNKSSRPSLLRIQQEKKITPLRIKVERTPGGTISKACIIPKEVKQREDDQVTPPATLRRTSSGSMLLRQTPERIRRIEEEMTSPIKRMHRSGSLPRLLSEKIAVEMHPSSNCPVSELKRKRTSSVSLSSTDSTSNLTPQRLRPRGLSESRVGDGTESPVKKRNASPIKKRVRQDSGSCPTSPMKKRVISTASIIIGGDSNPIQTAPVIRTPMRKFKSTIMNPKAITEHLAQTYGRDKNQKMTLTHSCSSANLIQPKLLARTTSGDSYYSATEELSRSKGGMDVFLTPSNSLQSGETMVPLVKKQVSIDEKILEDEEDEGFGDSMRTIKRGQGSALARSLSLKLSPKKEEPKPLGVDSEKSCSTPSLPTAPLVRQGSTSSLRFKVSPSTFLKPLTIPTTPTSNSPLETQAIKVTTMDSSEPSTSKMVEEKGPSIRKSALKKEAVFFRIREESFINVYRRRKIRFTGLNVHYFDRRQGESTVPREGDVTLGMHNQHHSHRYFSLASGKRPLLDLALYEDEELSDEEVIDPDSDDEHDYDEFTSAKSIDVLNQKHRIKLLKKSGVKVEKSAESVDTIRRLRVECGCSCENGVCLPETCQCAIDGIQCQVDGGDYPTHPCACFAETCTNPEGRTFYDPVYVHEYRQRTIMNWRAAQKIGVTGSPTIKKFVDSDDEEDGKKTSWILNNAIPIKLEASPAKYPVTPVYTRRSRSSLSDIRESASESNSAVTQSTSLSDRLKSMHNLENEVCVEEEEEVDKDETIVATNLTLQEVFVTQEAETATAEDELLDAAMTPVKPTLVV